MAALSAEELAHFYTHGYVVKQAIADDALCARARDHLWQMNDLPRFQRGQPASWGPFFGDEDNNQADDRPAAENAGKPPLSRRGYGFWLQSDEAVCSKWYALNAVMNLRHQPPPPAPPPTASLPRPPL
jgi:hypothetical protein